MSALDPRQTGGVRTFDGGGEGLADLLDRLLGTGVTVAGKVMVSLAGIDLLLLDLRVLLASIDTLTEGTRVVVTARAESRGGRVEAGGPSASGDGVRARDAAAPPAPARPAGAHGVHPASARPPARVAADERDPARGLAGLVVGLLELLRQVVERQALRRVEAGALDGDEVERLGLALRDLEERMAQLRDALAPDATATRRGPFTPSLALSDRRTPTGRTP